MVKELKKLTGVMIMQFILQQQQHTVSTDCQLSITLGDLVLIVCFNSSVGQFLTVEGGGRLVPCKDWRMCICVLEYVGEGGGLKGSQRELVGGVVCVGNAEPLAEQWLAMCCSLPAWSPKANPGRK